nr:hypothetical protein [Tanacetum cinerariifolium]
EKEKQEVKNAVEQSAKRRTRIIESLHNFRVIHKNSISLKNTSQISPVHEIAPVLSTKEPEHSLSMGYEHLSTTPETESNEVTESSTKNLLPIPSEYNDDLTSSDDESLSEEDVPIEESKRAQPEDSKELFQKLLEDLKELAEYKESLENSFNEIATWNSNQEKEGPPQDSDIRQLIREE